MLKMLLFSFLLLGRTFACTSVAANLGGVTFATHTADCDECDFRLAKVKRFTLPTPGEGAMLPLALYRAAYPREVSDRALTWNPE